MPNNNKKLARKYFVRRTLLLIAAIAALGGCVWLAVSLAGKSGDKQPPAESLSEASAAPETSSEQEPPSSSEPDPEPEPIDADSDWSLVLANVENPLPEGFAPPELTAITGEYSVDSRIAEAVSRMFAAAKGDGISLVICSAYRSKDYQQTLYDRKIQEFIDAGEDEQEAVATAGTIVAVPGTSEHQTGLALDIVTTSYQVLDEGFAETPAFRWLSEHAQEYGFVLRFPKNKQALTGIIYEPWHYRYVGIDNARRMNESDYCLEEYVYVLGQEKLRAASEASNPPESPADEVEN